MRRKVPLGLLAAALSMCSMAAAVLTPTAAASGQRAQTTCAAATPRQAVTVYFSQSARHDVAAAEACLTSRFRTFYAEKFADPDYLNMRTVKIEGISLVGAYPGEQPFGGPTPNMLYLALVTLKASFRHQFSFQDGVHRRYVMVGEAHPKRPWRIYGFLADVTVKIARR